MLRHYIGLLSQYLPMAGWQDGGIIYFLKQNKTKHPTVKVKSELVSHIVSRLL